MKRKYKDLLKLGAILLIAKSLNNIPEVNLTITSKTNTEIFEPISLQVDRHRAERDIKTTQDRVYWYLLDNGFSKEQTCAILGNIEQECGFNVNLVESNGVGFGLLQWSFERRTQLENMYDNPGNIYNQLDFFLYEYNQQWLQEYKNIFDNSTNLIELTDAFCWGYERPNVNYANLTHRRESAIYYFNLYQ